ncbi:uncharacterized protein LOC115267022, partial [Aedes albopictus]|uniref:SWIM-type domain-containing protein n=1 Tax=Aedes albopictus TaxID=7160 RepID=A0ABM1XJH7_AEDAL
PSCIFFLVPEDRDVEITIVDILDYVGDSVRPIKEGFAVFDANHIICLGYRTTNTSSVHITAYVTQSSHPGHSPHQVNLDLGPGPGSVSEWILNCTCKAGTAKCKHIIACLLYIEKHKRVEFLSCTDVSQAWGMSKAHKTAAWGAKRVKDMCCVLTPKKINVDVEGGLKEERIIKMKYLFIYLFIY